MTTALDPVTLAVIQNGLQQVCNEMDLAFVRAAFSPVISEALDRSDGIYQRTSGELIALTNTGSSLTLNSPINLTPGSTATAVALSAHCIPGQTNVALPGTSSSK